MSEKPVKILWIDRAVRGTGSHPNNYVAFFEGEEEKGQRGYGQTAREALADLNKQNV